MAEPGAAQATAVAQLGPMCDTIGNNNDGQGCLVRSLSRPVHSDGHGIDVAHMFAVRGPFRVQAPPTPRAASPMTPGASPASHTSASSHNSDGRPRVRRVMRDGYTYEAPAPSGPVTLPFECVHACPGCTRPLYESFGAVLLQWLTRFACWCLLLCFVACGVLAARW